MSKHKSPTPPPESRPLKEESAACKECGETVNDAGDAVRHVHRHLAERHGRAGDSPMPVERNTEAVNALSNAPPYLLSRAETMFGAYNHFMGGNSAPFHNLSVTERAAWLAVARSVGS